MATHHQPGIDLGPSIEQSKSLNYDYLRNVILSLNLMVNTYTGSSIISSFVLLMSGSCLKLECLVVDPYHSEYLSLSEIRSSSSIS
jgi:hypothetical protein